MKSVLFTVHGCALTLVLQLGAGRLHAQALEELQATARMCKAGPEARVARAARLVGAAQRTAAGVRSNPSLVVEHQRTFAGPSEHETVLGVAMPVALAGRRSLMMDAADARGEQAALQADADLFEHALAFRQAYVAAVLAQGRVAVLTEQQARLEQLSGVIEGLAKAGEAAGYDLLRQRMQVQLHQQSLDAARARAGAALALLEAWTGANVTLPAPPWTSLAGGSAADAAVVEVARHPSLRALDAQARAAGLEQRAADRGWLPELELFAGYRTATAASDTGHGISVALSVPLAIFDHGQGDAALARAEQARASADSDALQRHVEVRARALASWLDLLGRSEAQAAATAQLATGLEEKALQLYAAGEATITELLEALGAAEQARLAVLDVAEEFAGARLERMRVLGTHFDAAVDEACGATPGRTR